jgi:predicted type IV restriction endonuclease
MDLIDELKALSSKIAKQMDLVQTEEATKTAFIMPFIAALGYNVFDPTEVTPELDADVGIKKGEKIDYAIWRDGKPIMLIECKSCKTNLDLVNITQVYRYFSSDYFPSDKGARFGIITNGILYRFYADLEARNKMDKKPFLELNMLDIKDSVVEDIKRFSKSAFNLEVNITAATELKYMREIKRILSEQFLNPSEEFVKFFASQIHSGKVTQTIKQQFEELTKRALNQYITDRINEFLKSALTEASQPTTANQPPAEESETQDAENKIVTTEEEIEAYYIVKSLLRQALDLKRVVMRDTGSYCGILLDDKNRKPICRLYLNNPNKKYIGLFDTERNEEKVMINEVDDIYRYADRLQATIQYYDKVNQKEKLPIS